MDGGKEPDDAVGCDCGEEFTEFELERGVEVDVLRVADGRHHRAEICRDGLCDECDDRRARFGALEEQQGEGCERDEGDIVRDDHGGEEGERDEQEREASLRALGAGEKGSHAR